MRRAEREDATGYIVFNTPYSPKFRRIVGAIGWADPRHDTSEHWLLVGGETADARLVFLYEAAGPFDAIQKLAVDAKDAMLVEEYWIDATERDLHVMLAATDGLVQYFSQGLDYFGNEIWEHPSTYWPYFRDRDTVAMLMAVDSKIVQDAHRGLNRVVQLVNTRVLSLHSDCTQCAWIMDQRAISDVLHHPLAKAMSYCAWGLSPDMRGGEEWERPKPIYKNLK